MTTVLPITMRFQGSFVYTRIRANLITVAMVCLDHRTQRKLRKFEAFIGSVSGRLHQRFGDRSSVFQQECVIRTFTTHVVKCRQHRLTTTNNFAGNIFGEANSLNKGKEIAFLRRRLFVTTIRSSVRKRTRPTTSYLAPHSAAAKRQRRQPLDLSHNNEQTASTPRCAKASILNYSSTSAPSIARVRRRNLFWFHTAAFSKTRQLDSARIGCASYLAQPPSGTSGNQM